MSSPALIDAPVAPSPVGGSGHPAPDQPPRLVLLQGGRSRTGTVSSPVCRPVRLPVATARSRRLAVAAAVAAVLLAAAVWLDDGAVVPTQARAAPLAVGDDDVYVVQPGDTVWSIARRLDPRGDVRSTVDELVERHGSASVEVGDRLLLSGLRSGP
jgi:LysM domain